MGIVSAISNFISSGFNKQSTSQPTSTVTSKPAQSLGGTNVTDFSTGESVKTTTQGGQVTSQTYSPAPSHHGGGSNSTPAPIGEAAAIQATNTESRAVAGLPRAAPVDTGRFNYGFNTTSSTDNGMTATITAYNPQRLPSVRSTDEYSISTSKNPAGQTITTTTGIGTTSYGFDVWGDKTKYADFKTPSGDITTYAYNQGDKFAVNTNTGEIGVFKSGTPLPANSQRFDINTGQRLYGEGGLTADQLYANIQANVKTANIAQKIAYNIAPRLSLADPFGIKTLAYTIEDIYRFGKNDGNYAQTSRYNEQINNIYKQAYTKYAFTQSGEQVLTPYQFTATSPVAQTAVLAGGGYIVGGVISQAGLALTTLPSVASSLAPAISLGARAAPVIFEVAAPAAEMFIANAYANQKEKAFAAINQQGGDYADKIANVGVDVAKFAAFGYGLNLGIREGFPIVYRGVNIGETTISQGAYYSGNLGGSAYPIYTKTATGVDYATGAIQYQTGFGFPNKIYYPQLTEAYTPSGSIETAFYRRYVAQNFGNLDQSYLQSAYYSTTQTYGGKSPIIKEQNFREVDTFSKLSPEGQQDILDFLKQQRGYQVYGSSSTSVQTTSYRSPKDIDIQFFNDLGGTKAQEIANILSSTEGAGNVRIAGIGQVEVKQGQGFVKLFDIHGLENPEQFQAVANPFGFQMQKPIDISGIQSSQLSQEGVNKLASLGSMQPTEVIKLQGYTGTGKVIASSSYGDLPFNTPAGYLSPDPVRRLKDVADFYVIQKELVSAKTFGQEALNQNLEVYKTAAIGKFGTGIFNEYPQLIAFSSSAGSSSSLGASIASIGASFAAASPSFSRASSSSYGSLPSARPSPSYSQSYSYASPSPSISTSFSSSASPSISFASPSASVSTSPSISASSISSSYSPSGSSSYSFSTPPSPPILPPFAPFTLGGLSDLTPSNIVKGGKRKTRYTPSFSALVFKIHGTYNKKGKLAKSGLDFRPITKGYKFKIKGFGL